MTTAAVEAEAPQAQKATDENGSQDAVLLCCKKFPDSRSLKDIQAAMAVLKQEPYSRGELITALLKEGPFFPPKPEGKGRFSRLSSAAKLVSKAASFSRAPSLARAASTASANQPFSRVASQANQTFSRVASQASLGSYDSRPSSAQLKPPSDVPAVLGAASAGHIAPFAAPMIVEEQPDDLNTPIAPLKAGSNKGAKGYQCDNPSCKTREQEDLKPFEHTCTKCKSVKYCSKACQRSNTVAHKKVCKETSCEPTLPEDQTKGRSPSPTQGLLTQASSSLATKGLMAGVNQSRPPSASSQVSTSAITRAPSTFQRAESSVWDRVDQAQKEQTDEQGFTSVDHRLEYFLKTASLIRVKAGQTLVAEGSTGAAGKRFFIVLRGCLAIHKASTQRQIEDKLKEPLQVAGYFVPGMNKARQATRGPDHLIRVESGPGGPAWDSKHITLRDAESRYKSWKHMVDQRKHGSTFVTEQEKEAMHRKRQQERDSAELENAYQAQKVALEMGPLERVMGYVHEGDAFGEAECVEDVAFSTSAVGKKMHELDHDNSLTTKSKNEAAAILVALSMEDYLKLWPKRAKLVRERALWLHKAAACFLPFDRTDLVRVMSSSDVLEERILPGDVMCSQGDVPDKIRVVLSGSFSVQRQVNVDRAIKASRRINDQWMGPSDDWDSPKLVGLHDLEIESVAKEDRLEKSSTCEGVPSKKESTAIGVVDKSRAARALRRVVGFSGLSTSAKAHQQKKPRAHIPGCNDTAGNEHANVLVEVRRLEVGESFGFWGMIFKGQSEPNRIVARCECKVLSIPIAKVAQLKFDPDLRASFMEKQRLLVGVNEQQYQTMSALKRAQLVGRISAAQAWKFVDHLDGLDKEVPGRILKKDPYQYLPAASSGLEKHVPKTEHVPQVARVHTNLGDTSGLTSCVDRSQQGDADDKSLRGGGEYQKLLPHSLDMDAYMQRIYCDPNRNLGPQYREKEIPHLDYFEPVRHHHFKQVQEVFARRKAPDVLPYESMSAMCFDAMVLHSEKKVLSQHEAALQDKLLKLVDIFNTRRAKANTMNQVCNIREDVYISMLRESQLLIPRCCTKEMSSQLTFQKNAIDSHQASQIFSFHAMSVSHSSMRYMDETGFKISVGQVAKALDVPLPTAIPLSPVSSEDRLKHLTSRSDGLEQDSKTDEPSHMLAATEKLRDESNTTSRIPSSSSSDSETGLLDHGTFSRSASASLPPANAVQVSIEHDGEFAEVQDRASIDIDSPVGVVNVIDFAAVTNIKAELGKLVSDGEKFAPKAPPKKKPVGVEKSNDSKFASDAQKWTSQFDLYHQPNSRKHADNLSKNAVPIPLKSIRVGNSAKHRQKPSVTTTDPALKTAIIPKGNKKVYEISYEKDTPNLPIFPNGGISQAFAAKRHAESPGDLFFGTVPEQCPASRETSREHVLTKDRISSKLHDETIKRPSTSLGFVRGTTFSPTTETELGWMSGSAHGIQPHGTRPRSQGEGKHKRGMFKVSLSSRPRTQERSKIDVCIPSPLLGRWDRPQPLSAETSLESPLPSVNTLRVRSQARISPEENSLPFAVAIEDGGGQVL